MIGIIAFIAALDPTFVEYVKGCEYPSLEVVEAMQLGDCSEIEVRCDCDDHAHCSFIMVCSE